MAIDEAGNVSLFLSNRSYDILKFAVQVVIPALCTCVFALGQIWGWAWSEEIVGTFVIINTFLGVFVGRSSKKYKEETGGDLVGFIDIREVDGVKTHSLEFPGDPDTIALHDKVTFKVRTHGV